MVNNVEVSIQAKIDEQSFKNEAQKIQKFARDTWKELDLNVVADLELNVAGLEQDLRAAKRQLRDFEGSAEEELELRVNVNRLKDWLTNARKELRNYRTSWDKEISALQLKFDDLKQSAWGIKDVLVGAFSFAAIGGVAREIFNVTKSFERYEAVLTNALGSQSAATESLNLIKDVASKTPFEVDQLTESYIKLVNRWFKPTADEIIKLGDLAASQGKDFDQLAEALLDAQTGEFERLKEFGVRASVAGDQVAFTFRGQTVEVQKTEEAIRDYVLSLGEVEGITGSLDAQSKTLEGQLSNVQDTLSQIALSIGEKLLPFIKALVGGFQTLIGSSEGLTTITVGITALWVAIAVATWGITALAAWVVALVTAGAWLVSLFSETKNEISGLNSEITNTETKLEELRTEYENGNISLEEYSQRSEELQKTLELLQRQYDQLNDVINDNNKTIKRSQTQIDGYTESLLFNEQKIRDVEKALADGDEWFSIFGLTIVDNEKKLERLNRRSEEWRQELANAEAESLEASRINELLSGTFGSVDSAINQISTAQSIEEFNALKESALNLIQVFANLGIQQLAIAREAGDDQQAEIIRNRLKGLQDTVSTIRNLEFKTAQQIADNQEDKDNNTNKRRVGAAKKTAEDIQSEQNKIFEQWLEEQRRLELRSIERSGKSKEEQLLDVIELERRLLNNLRQWGVASWEAIKKAYERVEDALFALQKSSSTAFEWLNKNIEDSLGTVKELEEQINDLDKSISELWVEGEELVANRLRDIQDERAELQEELEELNRAQSNLGAQVLAQQEPTIDFGRDEIERQQEILAELAKLDEEALVAEQNTTEEALEKIDKLRAETETDRIIREINERREQLEQERAELQESKDKELQILKNFFDQGKALAEEFAQTFNQSLEIGEDRLNRLRQIASEIQSLSGSSVGQSIQAATAASNTVNNNQQTFQNTFNVNSTIDLLQASRQIALDSNR